MIVWLASYPRSGNTFLRILMKSVFGIETYSKYGDATDIGADKDFSDLVGHKAFNGDWESFRQAKAEADAVSFIKTHDAPEDDGKAIYLIRDGRPCAWSFKRYLDNYSEIDFDIDDVVLGSVPFGAWNHHVESWSPRTRDNTLVVRFEDLTGKTASVLQDIGEFLGLDLPDDFKAKEDGYVPAFETLQERFPKFFRSGSNDETLDKLPDDVRHLMNKHFGPTLIEWGYAEEANYDPVIAERLEAEHQAKVLRLRRALKNTRKADDVSGVLNRLEDSLAAIEAKEADPISKTDLASLETRFEEKLGTIEKDITEKVGAALEAHLKTALDGSIAAILNGVTGPVEALSRRLDAAEAGMQTSVERANAETKSLLDGQLEASLARIEAISRRIDETEAGLQKSVEQANAEMRDAVADMNDQTVQAFEARMTKDMAKLKRQVDNVKTGVLKAVDGVASEAVPELIERVETGLSQLGTDVGKVQSSVRKSIAGARSKTVSALEEQIESNLLQLETQLSAKVDRLGVKTQQLGRKIEAASPEAALRGFEAQLAEMSELMPKLDSSREAREEFVRTTGAYVSELQQRNNFLITALIETEDQSASDARRADRLQKSVRRLSRDHDALLAKLGEYEEVLQPRFKSLLQMRPWRYIMEQRRLVRAGEISSEPEYFLASELVDETNREIDAEPQPERRDLSDALKRYKTLDIATTPAAPEPAPLAIAAPAQATSLSGFVPTQVELPQGREELGVAVFTFDRQDLVHSVLESLAQQDKIGLTHVFIDGDQGKPTKRAMLDKTEELVRSYDVRQIHRYRGNYGFRKMMLTAQRKMMERYDKIIFLEDDCFPTHNAVEEFSRELDRVKDDPSIFSVYGHPFLVPGEDKPFGRFQGWGWATTADKLKPVWEELMRLYLMTEDEYKAWVEQVFTPEVKAAIDITPGRQPSHTVTKFFAWDEALTLICGVRGLKHKRSDTRLIYNCGVGGSSAHFSKIEHFRKPPFNMVHPDHVWDHF